MLCIDIRKSLLLSLTSQQTHHKYRAASLSCVTLEAYCFILLVLRQRYFKPDIFFISCLILLAYYFLLSLQTTTIDHRILEIKAVIQLGFKIHLFGEKIINNQ